MLRNNSDKKYFKVLTWKYKNQLINVFYPQSKYKIFLMEKYWHNKSY